MSGQFVGDSFSGLVLEGFDVIGFVATAVWHYGRQKDDLDPGRGKESFAWWQHLPGADNADRDDRATGGQGQLKGPVLETP